MREIIWNNRNWVVDDNTRTIYQKATMFENDPNLLTVQATVGNYPFREFMGNIYFEASGKYYKITNDEVSEISVEEYKNQAKLKKLDIKNPADVRFISTYVSAAIIDALLMAKHNVVIDTKVENSNFVPIISSRFPSAIKGNINYIAKLIISLKPYIDRSTVKKEVKNYLSDMIKSDDNYFSEMFNIIYKNDQITFDALAENVKNQSKQRNQNPQYNSDFVQNEENVEGKRR